MIKRPRLILDPVVVAAFAVSTAIAAWRSAFAAPAGPELFAGLTEDFDRFTRLGSGAIDSLPVLPDIVARPVNPVMWSLLVAVVIAALIQLTLLLRNRSGIAVPYTVTLGLALAALWPWIESGWPVTGRLCAVAAAAAMVAGVAPARGRRRRKRVLWLSAFITGWLLMAAAMALGSFAQPIEGIGAERAMLAALLLAALTGTWVQLRIGGHVSFSLAIIWAMIGISSATLSPSITIATACVLGISALAVVLVRVTT